MDDNEYYAQAEHDERHAKFRALATATSLLEEVYRQAGNSAPAERRHALTPDIRDRIRDYLKDNTTFGTYIPDSSKGD